MINVALTLKEIGHFIQEDWHILIRKLISEHIDELDACCLELAKIIDFDILKLWQDQIFKIIAEQIEGDINLIGSLAIGISGNRGGNDEIKYSCFLNPFFLRINLILLE